MPGFEIFGEEEKKEILDVLGTGVLFRYEFAEQRKGIYKVREFEKAFASYCGCGHAQAVTSGTVALKVALVALGVGPGDEVITQCFTFVATWEAILDIGAIPVIAEVDETLNIDPTDVERKITDKTRVIIPVHMMGAQARVDEIVAIAEKYNIAVLEDTAQATGGTLAGKYLGTYGNCGTFSFDPVKTITTGEGGMIITDSEKMWSDMSEYHDHGHDHAVNPRGRGGEGRSFIGFNYRMMELQGAIGLAQLAKLNGIIASQKENKKVMKAAISQIPSVTFREILDEEGDTATFLSFFLPDAATAKKTNDILNANSAGAVYFAVNTWHYYPKWEHLLNGKTLANDGYPFQENNKKRVIYAADALPASAAIMDRLLVYQVPINLSAERLQQITVACDAVKKEIS